MRYSQVPYSWAPVINLGESDAYVRPNNTRSVGVFILLRFVLLCYRNFYYSGVYSKNISHNIRKRNQSEYKVGKIYVERENL